jgi:tetratricopeptide (TPR) repeat protein
MTSSARERGLARSRPSGRLVVSGQIPPLADSYSRRQETGVDPASLPPGRTTVLLPPDDGAASSLRGLGGTGKTHLAATVARGYLNRGTVGLVLWITAVGQDAVIGSYERAWHDLGMPTPAEGPQRAAAQFRDWLASTDQPWLVVLDDLNDAGTLEDLWPRGAAGRVLVTTNRRDAVQRPDSHVTMVGAFSPREALGYLTEWLRTEPDHRIGAPDLAAELGFLPIALGQAVAVMTGAGLGCREYRALLAERKSQLTAGSADTYASIATAAWSLSVEFADQLPPAGLARRALTLISVLGPQGIPGTLLATQAARTYLAGYREGFPPDEAQARAAVQNLARAGLVTIDTGSARTVLAHELVQTIARQSLSPAEGDQAVRAAADALTEMWSGPGRPADVEQSLRDCAAKLRGVGGTALWAPQCHPVLMQAGQSLVSSGYSGPALAYWRTMLGISERHLGPGHAQTVRFRDLLGSTSGTPEHAGEAIVVYQDVLTRLENTEGSCHPATLAARASLARAYRAADRPRDAINLTAQTVAECDQVLGTNHPDTLAARGNLADSYLAAGRAKEAIDLRKRILAELERVQGPDHLDTIAARASLALAYRSMKKLKDAVKLYQRALADRERVQGPGHRDTIVTRRELAFSYHLAGKLAYSVAQYERALADCREALGPGHALTQVTREDLDVVASHARAKLGIDLRTAAR